MAKARWIKLGSAEGKIVRWLATNPRQNIYSIQKGCGYPFHSTISKAVHNLENKGLLDIVDTYISEKGKAVNLWGLSSEGRGYCITYSSDFEFDRAEIMEKFREEDEDIDELLSTFELLDDLGIEDAEELKDKILESSFKAYGGGLDTSEIFSMLLGQFILKTMKLGDEDNKKIIDWGKGLLEKDSRKKIIEKNPILEALIKRFLAFYS